MSRKMLNRGRYPRDASLYSNHGSLAQVPEPVASASINYTQPQEVPLYNTQPVQQFQSYENFQNSWQSNSSQFSQQTLQQSVQNSWQCDPHYSQAGVSENNVWNWTPENSVPSHSLQPVPQPQQFHPSQVPNTISQYPSDTSSHAYYSGESMQSTNVNYNVQNDWYAGDPKKLNGNKLEQMPQSSWETDSANISQAEQLPWTYSVPQNAVTAAENFSQWADSSYTQSGVSYAAVVQNWNKDSAESWWESGYTDYQKNQVSHTAVQEQNAVVQDNTFVPYQGALSQQDNTGYVNSVNSVENFESCTPVNTLDVQVTDGMKEVAENENSGLNAFFHHSIEENVEVAHENPSCETAQELQMGQANEENIVPALLPDPEVQLYSVKQLQDENADVGSSTLDSEVQDDSEGFVQNLTLPSKSAVPSVHPVEEPLNQEVPEPCPVLPLQQAKKENVLCEDSPDEPLNQQVPAETAALNAIEQNGAVHEESSPFKQPVKSSTTGSIVQKESTSKSSFAKSASHGGFQEVNLETVPDNLERPPDYDDLRKESSLSASFRQHLRSMEKDSILDTSKASLWEDPKLPCVLLAPAAPLQVKAPSLLSIDSTQMSEPKPIADVTSIAASLQDLHIKTPVTSSPSLPLEEKPHSTTPSPVPILQPTKPVPVEDTCGSAKETVPNSNNSKSSIEIVKPDYESSRANSELVRTTYDNLKTDRSQSGSPAVRQTSPVKEPRQAISSVDMSRNEHYPSPHSDVERERHSRSYTDMRGRPPPDFDYDPNSRYNNRPVDRYPDRRFADSRYSSFEERPSYHKEGSRPSSRMSLDESMESHVSREHHYRKNYNSDYDRPPSRMSESEAYRASHREEYPYFDPHYNNRASYGREEEYYRTRGYRGYEYDPYQAARPYYGYYDPYRYSYSNYNYGFYDELYRNDPRYRKQMEDQYREYYKRLGYETDYERSSAYSGRSSANELSKEVSQRYPENDASSSDMQYQNYEQESQFSSYETSDGKESVPVCRLTPVKFSSPHAFLNFTPSGQLLKFVPAVAASGYPPLIEIHSMQEICKDTTACKELKEFQGPLVRRETHKNDIIDFCLKKVKFYKQKQGIYDRDSYILLWELLILLLRQNGSVAGSDIAELLLKDHEVLRPPLLRHASDIPQGDSSPADASEAPAPVIPAGDASSPDEGIVVTRDKTVLNNTHFDMDKVTRKFREFLLFGHKKDALEWAMKHNLWGHALFLASKMDVRTYANVMTRFANSLALNDPLQTLYQLMSGRQPAAVTCVADRQWGDWRPHLAMILSNPSAHSEVDFKSITTLGDTLAAQGCLPATQFCYLMAQVEFGSYSCKSSKMVLLLGDHQLPFSKFASNEAIQCTEIYEYAQSLANPGFILNHLQAYKFIYATRLADNGFLQEALHYCEILTMNFLSNPSAFPVDLIKQVYELSLRLKYHDPHYMQGQGELEEQEDPEWLKALASLLGSHAQENQSYNAEGFESQPDNGNSADVYQQNSAADAVAEQSSAEVQNESCSVQQNYNAYSNTWITGNILQPQQQQQYTEISSYEPQFQPQEMANQSQLNYSAQWNISAPKKQEMYYDNHATMPIDDVQSSLQQSPSQKFNFYGSESQMPMHSIHSKERTSSTSSIGFGKDRRDSVLSSGSEFGSNNKSIAETQKPEDKSDKPRPQVGRSWLGGIFSKLLPKAPNQMILPDDKNPTIVWDPVKNRWINTDSKDDDTSSQPSAPPRDTELTSKVPDAPSLTAMPPVAAASSPMTNKFQRQKVKGMRQNYVDILNPTSSLSETSTSGDVLFPTMPASHAPAKLLVPIAPVSDDPPMDFVSTQSYSFGTAQDSEDSVPQAPPMFDPAEFDSRRPVIGSVRHSIGSAHRTYPT